MAERSMPLHMSLVVLLAIMLIGAGVVLSRDSGADQKELVPASASLGDHAKWIPFIKGARPEKPEVHILWSNFSSIRLRLTVPGIHFTEVEYEGEVFTQIHIPGYGLLGDRGRPAVPAIKELLQIPYGAEPIIKVVDVREREFTLEELGLRHMISPSQLPVTVWDEKMDFVMDEDQYGDDEYYPEEWASVVSTGSVRGCRFAQIRVTPVRYNAVRGIVRFCLHVEIEISLLGSDILTTQQMLKRYASPPYRALFKSLFLNHESCEHQFSGAGIAWDSTGPESPTAPIGYLIITPASFEDALGPLVEWKTKKGFNVTVAKTSEIGSDTSDIRAYIDSAYENWSIPPSYVVFASDVDSIPTYSTDDPDYQGTRTAVDLFYVTVDTNDYFPDIFRGRLPAQDSSELRVIVEKILAYEKVYSEDQDWMNKFCLIVGELPDEIYDPDRDEIVFPDSNIFNCMEVDTASNDSSKITAAVNEGRSLVTYVDHSGWNGWYDPPYSSSKVRNSLSNEDMYPFVLSFSCNAGRFDVDECFAEVWVKEEDKGAIAFWGACAPADFPHSHYIEQGMYEALCGDGDDVWIVSVAADRGLWYLYNEYDCPEDEIEYHFQAFNIVGDPSIDMWTDACDSLEVDYDPHIETGRVRYRVDVEDNSSDVEDAFVCLYKEDDVFATGYTNASGYVILSIVTSETGTMHVTVTKHNYKPHEGTVGVWESLICGDVNSDSEVDSLDLYYLEAYLWYNGDPPQPVCLGDVDCDGDVDLGDVVYLTNYLYHEGDPPCDECCD